MEDRLAKEALAVPMRVRRVDYQSPTDQTMATRGSGSSSSQHGFRPVDGTEVSPLPAQSSKGADPQVSMFLHAGNKEKHGLWERIKHGTRQSFRRRKK